MANKWLNVKWIILSLIGLVGCTNANPEIQQLFRLFPQPTFEGKTVVSQTISSLSAPVPVSGECDTHFTSIEISRDDVTWETPPATSADLSCKDKNFSFTIPHFGEFFAVTSGPANVDLYIRGVSKLGPSSSSRVSLQFVPSATAVLTDTPSAITNVSSILVTVGGADIIAYKYKLGVSASTDCSLSTGYGIETNIPSQISETLLADGEYTLCVLGKNMDGLWQLSSSPSVATWALDTSAPTVTLSSDASEPTNAATIAVTVTFSENVTGFAVDDLVLINATASDLTGSGASYSFNLNPSSQGTVGVSVNTGATSDSATNASLASNTLTRTYDNSQPNVSLTSVSSEPTGDNPIVVGINFSEAVTGFDSTDLMLNNATVANFSGSGGAYIVELMPSSQGAVSISIAANAAHDTAGNFNTVSNTLTRNYDTVGPNTPTITLLGSVPNTLSESPTLSFTSGVDAISGWNHDEVRLLRASDNEVIVDWTSFISGSNFASLTLQDGIQYYFRVRSVDNLGNLSSEAVSSNWTANLITVVPTLLTTVLSPTNVSSIRVDVNFNFDVIDFDISDVSPSNGAVGNFAGGGRSYSFDLIPSGQGTVSVDIASGTVKDLWGNPNVASNILSLDYDSTPPVVTLNGAPTGTDYTTALNVDVLNTDGVVQYQYKIGDGTIACSDSTGYSTKQSESIDITDDISGLPDGTIKLCVIGGDAAGNWQSHATATSVTWTKAQLNLIATVSGHPSSISLANMLNITVGGNNVTHYKYKLGVDGSTDCSASADYSSERTIETLITDDLSSYIEGTTLKLCVIGGQSGGLYQTMAQATSVTWFKDTITEANFTDLGNSYADSAQLLSFTIALHTPRPYDVTVNYGVGGDSSSVDHDLLPGSVTIPSGQSSATVFYNLLRNIDVNPEKSLNIYITGSNQPGVIPGPQAYQFNTIRDTDGGIYSTVSQTATGGTHTCVVNSSGQLKCWGANAYGQLGDGTTIDRFAPTVVDSTTAYSMVATGKFHTCGITTADELKCWGYNTYGQLGDGSTTQRNTPTLIDSGIAYTSVTVGYKHTCGITKAGDLKCWGYNTYGQLGDGSTMNQFLPTVINSGTAYTQVTATNIHTCSITSAGALKCWGSNAYGQLGDGSTTQRSSPTLIDSGITYSQIATGDYHTCGITSAGELKCWGTNTYGQLGNGTYSDLLSPTVIDSEKSYKWIAAGIYHSCGITSSDQLKCWGYNNSGQLGDGTLTKRTLPAVIDPNARYSAVSAGGVSSGSHTCGITTAGQIKCWGSNSNGQLGDGSFTQRTSPIPIDLPTTYSKVMAGNAHTCGVTGVGDLKCWGANNGSQLGDGTKIQRTSPTLIDLGSKFTQISSGNNHTCGITDSGQLKCWGNNMNGQVGDGSSGNYKSSPTAVDAGTLYTQVAAGNFHTCGITTSGQLKCWGYNGGGRLGDDTTTDRLLPTLIDSGTAYTAITAGGAHTCGITSAGELKCWGRNDFGQLGDGTTSPRTTPTLIDSGTAYTAITAGDAHACGITSAGELKCWGSNSTGQLGDGTMISTSSPISIDSDISYFQITAGYHHTCGITTASQLKCWGSNSTGQLGDGSTPWIPHLILHVTEP